MLFFYLIGFMKKLSVVLYSLIILSYSYAQDPNIKDLQSSANKDLKSNEKDGWTRSGTLVLNLNQGSLHNWAAGGEQNTLGINGLFNYGINYRKGRNSWNNYFDLALGFLNATSFNRFRKIDDRIDITSKYGYQLSKKWYLATLANFNSQGMAGYDYPTNTKISNFLTPGKILLSVGFDFRPNNDFSLFVSPITTRWILKQDADFFALDKFGVAAFQKSYNEVGAYTSAKYIKNINSWAVYTGRVDLFSNYKRKPGNVDLLFNNLLAMKFNKWLGTTISLDMIYDDDVIKALQEKEILGVGLTVKL